MPSIYKIEKVKSGRGEYYILFPTREKAEKWIEDNKELGFFKCCIKEIVLGEKLTGNN